MQHMIPNVYVLGIWGIPLYIYEQIIGIDPTYFFWPLFYGKSIYIVALVISAYLIYRICKELGINSQNSILGKLWICQFNSGSYKCLYYWTVRHFGHCLDFVGHIGTASKKGMEICYLFYDCNFF